MLVQIGTRYISAGVINEKANVCSIYQAAADWQPTQTHHVILP